MKTQGIRARVLQHVVANPNVSRSQIMAVLNLDIYQASNALAYWRGAKRLSASGLGCATTWAVKPEQVAVQPVSLMAMFGK